MTETAQQFYHQLYSPKDINIDAVTSVLQHVPNNLLSDSTTRTTLTMPFTLNDVLEGVK